MEYRFSGIILNKYDVGETDRIYSIFTLEGGKIRSLAKGVRKPHAKLAASLENITLADIVIVKSRGIGKITGAIVENNFSKIKLNYDALKESLHGLNIFDKLVDYENPDIRLFLLLREYLETIEGLCGDGTAEKLLLLRLGFTVKILDALGYAIEADSCVSCGELPSSQDLHFSSSSGGIICKNCSLISQSSVISVKANSVKLIRLFLKNEISNLSKIRVTADDCDNLGLVVDDFLRWNT